jgi:hypothetical protein
MSLNLLEILRVIYYSGKCQCISYNAIESISRKDFRVSTKPANMLFLIGNTIMSTRN